MEAEKENVNVVSVVREEMDKMKKSFDRERRELCDEIYRLKSTFEEKGLNDEIQKELQVKDEIIETLKKRLEKSRKKIEEVCKERDDVVHSAETDAKRIRELWEATIAKHKEQKAAFESSSAGFRDKIADLEAEIDKLHLELDHAHQNCLDKNNEALENSSQVVELKTQMEKLNGKLHRVRSNSETKEKLVALAKYSQTAHVKLEGANLKLSQMENEYQKLALKLEKCKMRLEEKSRESETLRIEFDTIIEHHEELLTLLRSDAQVKVAKQRDVVKQLQQEKEYSDAVIQNLQQQLDKHQRVLKQVDSQVSRVGKTAAYMGNHSPQKGTTDLNDTFSIYGVFKPPV